MEVKHLHWRCRPIRFVVEIVYQVGNFLLLIDNGINDNFFLFWLEVGITLHRSIHVLDFASHVVHVAWLRVPFI